MANTYLRGKTHITINKVKLYNIAGTYNNEIVKKSKFKITQKCLRVMLILYLIDYIWG